MRHALQSHVKAPQGHIYEEENRRVHLGTAAYLAWTQTMVQKVNAPKAARPTTRSNQANLYRRSKWLRKFYALSTAAARMLAELAAGAQLIICAIGNMEIRSLGDPIDIVWELSVL
ncbi:hypothetical protein A6U86_05335 [Rhizobium sp. AC27/96]|nr:hypothetical protein A6U86_05335 [Rhizobium sp. AC27/96]